MANIADTLYRIYGSKETLDFISENVKIGMTHREALEKCGIMHVDTDRLCMRGSIQHVEKSERGFVDIQSDDAWTEQQGFITALEKRFVDDAEFRIEFRCEEPGCDYYVSNVAGAIFGEYVSDLDCQTEYHETFEDLCKAVISYLQRNSSESPAQWKDFAELHDYCDTYNDGHEDHPLFVHEFTIL